MVASEGPEEEDPQSLVTPMGGGAPPVGTATQRPVAARPDFAAGRPVKGIFKDLGSREYNPPIPERARWLIMALKKRGKSSFVCSHGRCAIFDWEGGAASVKRPKGYIFHIAPTPEELRSGQPAGGYPSLNKWERYVHVRDLLIKDASSGNPDFFTVALDTVDAMVDHMILRFCQGANNREEVVANISDYKDGRAGWYEVRAEFHNELQALYAAGYGLMLPAHQTEKVYRDGDKVRVELEWKLAPSIRDVLLAMADNIVLLERRTTPVTSIVQEMVRGRPHNRTVVKAQSQIVLRTIGINGDEDMGMRVEVPDELVIPESEGWSTVAKAYNEEVIRVKRENTARGR